MTTNPTACPLLNVVARSDCPKDGVHLIQNPSPTIFEFVFLSLPPKRSG